VSSVWRASADEAEQVAALLVEFRDHLGHSTPSQESFLDSVQKLIDRSDTEFWLAAPEGDPSPAAVCQLRFRHSVWTAAEDCWLEDLFVRDSVRGQGLGRALVLRALERAAERGCRRVELDTNEDNHAALGLYTSLGFSTVSKGDSRSLFLGASVDGGR
jgi:GNAT superfamily N-acetyltransferase